MATLAEALKGTSQEQYAAELDKEFQFYGITLETIDNAPVTLRKTHGADIYEVIKLVKKHLASHGTARIVKPVGKIEK